jgi:hypothetical protein
MEPTNPKFVAKLRKQKAAAERRRASGTRARQDHAHDVSIDHAYWTFEHSVGIVYLEASAG